MVSRRQLLQMLSVGTLTGVMPSLSFANTASNARLVLVILRGAADGLAIAPPLADPYYNRLRGELALDQSDALKLDDLFGLHPSLSHVHQEFGKGNALLLHAIASPYRARSHFDGQDVLENGGDQVGLLRDGWLNRALQPLRRDTQEDVAIAMAQNTPLVLRGDQSVTSWAPSQLPETDGSTLARLQDLYADDEFFASRLAQALRSQEIADGQGGMKQRRQGNAIKQFVSTMQTAGRFLTADGGPQIAVVESSGWDTHSNQGSTSGNLANQLKGLDDGIAALHQSLGDTWSQTVVAVVTEFGRTVRVNGTRGTDHGTGAAAMLIGGAVAGGRVLADWPGLNDADLYDGRDLRPTADLRSLFKGVLGDHLQVTKTTLDTQVFPDSQRVAALPNLIKG